MPFSITFHFPPNVEKTLLICLISIVWLSICDPHQMVAAGTVLVKSRGATQSIYQSRNTWDFSKQQRKGSGWSQIETHVIKKDWERKIWVVGLWETNFTRVCKNYQKNFEKKLLPTFHLHSTSDKYNLNLPPKRFQNKYLEPNKSAWPA